MKANRDIEKQYPASEVAEKLRRLADCIEKEENFEIQVAGEKSMCQIVLYFLLSTNATVMVKNLNSNLNGRMKTNGRKYF